MTPPGTLRYLLGEYGAELKEGVAPNVEPNGITYCVNIPGSLDGASVEGQLAVPTTFEPQGYVKSDGTTLKLRLLRPAAVAMDGIDFCKGEFTLDPAPAAPNAVVTQVCDTTGAFLPGGNVEEEVEERLEFCRTVVCRPGTICSSYSGQYGDIGSPGSPVRCSF